MRMDRLTSKFQEALSDAQSLAVGRDHQFVEPVHLMTALLDQQGGSVRPLFTHAGVNINRLRSQLGEQLEGRHRHLGEQGLPQQADAVPHRRTGRQDAPLVQAVLRVDRPRRMTCAKRPPCSAGTCSSTATVATSR